jgi:hypothetical protein
MSGIGPQQNAFKFNIQPHQQKFIAKNVFGKKMPLSLLANGALCLNTPKRNCKSSTDLHQIRSVERLESQINLKSL